MKDAPKVREGDRIRVVLEGKARYCGDAYFDVAQSCVHLEDDEVVSVEVLSKSLKVGDTIEGKDAYDSLPIGAVTSGLGRVVMRTGDGFVNNDGRPTSLGSFFNPRTLVYLPE